MMISGSGNLCKYKLTQPNIRSAEHIPIPYIQFERNLYLLGEKSPINHRIFAVSFLNWYLLVIYQNVLRRAKRESDHNFDVDGRDEFFFNHFGKSNGIKTVIIVTLSSFILVLGVRCMQDCQDVTSANNGIEQ